MKLKNNWPYLVLLKHDCRIQILVVGERQVITEADTLWEGLKGLLGAYFAFNIECPNKLRALLIFIQHYVFKVRDTQSTPKVVKQVKSSLDKICI